ncbi:phosphotransferase enzyme family protein [Vreelandella sp. EE7]
MYTQALLSALQERLTQALPCWQLPGDTHVKLLTTSENATFLAASPATGQTYTLRVHRPHYQIKREIESELAWLDNLRRARRVETPSPLPTLTDSPVIQLRLDGRCFYAVAFEYIEGEAPNWGQGLPDWFEKLGAITASLHEHSKAWQPPTWFVRKRWDLETMIGPNALWGDWRQALGITASDERAIERAIERIYRFIEAYGSDERRYGLIHADLRPANLLVKAERLSVIDFDDSGFCWYAFDFAAAVSFFELDPLVPRLRKAWLRGYRRIATFDEYDEAALDTFIMIRRIMLSAWLVTHAESPTAKALSDCFIQGTAALARTYLGISNVAPRLHIG